VPLSADTAPGPAEVLAELRSMMASEFDLDPAEIEPSKHLMDDLDLDSIDLVDLAVSLEERSGIKLDEDELKAVRTVADAIDVVHAACERRSRGAA